MQLTGYTQIYDIDPFSTSTTQVHSFGTVGVDKVGRRYRYVKAGAVALVKGNLLQSPARDTAFTDMAVQAAAAIGATSISITLGGTSTTANIFNDGFLVITTSTGIGQNLVIKRHDVATNATTCVFDVYEPLSTAIATSSKATAMFNPYSAVIVSPTTRTGLTVGVAIAAIPIANFGWIGTHGIFGVLSDATVAAVGESVGPSTTTAGTVTKQVTLLENVGTAPILGVSAEDQPVHFRID